jgi:hypothetical protein
MRQRKGFVIVLGVALIALAIGAILAAPVLADPAGKVKGVVTGEIPVWDLEGTYLGSLDFQYIWNIHQVDESGAAKGFATTMIGAPGTERTDLKVEFDCLQFFVTEDGRSAAIYSGKIVKAKQPDSSLETFGVMEGRLKIGMVIDGGLEGPDEVYYWTPLGTMHYPDEGTPLGCVVPEGSVMLPFVVTGGDVEVRMP